MLPKFQSQPQSIKVVTLYKDSINKGELLDEMQKETSNDTETQNLSSYQLH